MKVIDSSFTCYLCLIMFFNSCSISKENNNLIQQEEVMWEMVSNYDFDRDKIVHKMDSIYIKTFDLKVKYKIVEVDCCYKKEKTMSIRTSAINKNESIIFYFDNRLQIIDIVHELPPLYVR